MNAIKTDFKAALEAQMRELQEAIRQLQWKVRSRANSCSFGPRECPGVSFSDFREDPD
jgi:hypothetical protein